ncbi:MAG: hypothetical protein ACR2NO_02220 [Chloroflexota bacterium]
MRRRGRGPARFAVDSWSTTAPGGAVLLEKSATHGGCQPASASSVTCALGSLGPGSAASVRVTFQPGGPGWVTNMATASASEHDHEPSNNTTSESTSVGAG